MTLNDIKSIYPWGKSLWDKSPELIDIISESSFYNLIIASNERCMISGVKFSLDIHVATPKVLAAKPVAIIYNKNVFIVAQIIADLLHQYDIPAISELAISYSALISRENETKNLDLKAERDKFYQSKKEEWLKSSLPESRICNNVETSQQPFHTTYIRQQRLEGTGAHYITEASGMRLYLVSDFVIWLNDNNIKWEFCLRPTSYPKHLQYVKDHTENYQDLVLDVIEEKIYAEQKLREEVNVEIAELNARTDRLYRSNKNKDLEIKSLEDRIQKLVSKKITVDVLKECDDYWFIIRCAEKIKKYVVEIMEVVEEEIVNLEEVTQSSEVKAAKHQLEVLNGLYPIIRSLKYNIDGSLVGPQSTYNLIRSDSLDPRLGALVAAINEQSTVFSELLNRLDAINNILAERYAKERFGLSVGNKIKSIKHDENGIISEIYFNGMDNDGKIRVHVRALKFLKSGKTGKSMFFFDLHDQNYKLVTN